jgi:hypothetical protein
MNRRSLNPDQERDSPEHLTAAAEYLIKYSSKTSKKAG